MTSLTFAGEAEELTQERTPVVAPDWVPVQVPDFAEPFFDTRSNIVAATVRRSCLPVVSRNRPRESRYEFRQFTLRHFLKELLPRLHHVGVFGAVVFEVVGKNDHAGFFVGPGHAV